MKRHPVTLILGDGTGPELAHVTKDVLDATGVAFDWTVAHAGVDIMEKAGTPLPPETLEAIKATKTCIKAPITTPVGTGFRSVNVALRKEFDLYMNLRPIRSFPTVPSRYRDVDLLIFRENSEDLYLGRERMVDADTAEAVKVITRGATERAARFACELMTKLGRKRLAIAHKSNVLKMTDGLFLRAAQGVAAGYPDIEVRDRVIDALCMELVLAPERYDCLLLANLYGDIVSDLCAGLVGGLGLAPGANIGERCAIFEAVHGTAPDIAGRDIANPMAMILSAVMMLRHLGELDAANRIEQALTSVLQRHDRLTPDLGGSGGTRAMAAAIIEAL